MKWELWQSMYLSKHCSARGLKVTSIVAYKNSLKGFVYFMKEFCDSKPPDKITITDVLEYVEYLRCDRNNGDSAVNRAVTVVRMFYRACVAMQLLDPKDNPMAHFPTMKAPCKKFKPTLDTEEVKKLINQPRSDTIIGLRDRALLVLGYGTGGRASEMSQLNERDVDLDNATVWFIGKGGDSRSVPLNKEVINAMRNYRQARGVGSENLPFFISRQKNRLSRNAIYERVRTHSQKAKITKHVSPHTLRHTFATHLVRSGVSLPVLRDLLGHRQLASTEIYIHMTANDIRSAVAKHPIKDLMERVVLEEGVRLPFQLTPYFRSG